ncbi:MAG TPA: amidase [Pyrinomonadaceae bacterium]|jgi:amidase|nr:amidase [Pyrinomonadaceae bacterium]
MSQRQKKQDGSVKRREFLQSSIIGGALALAGVSVERAEASKGAAAGTRATHSSFELEEMTVADLQKAMQTGKLSSRSITGKYLSRIDDVDKHGPTINSVIEINPDALEIAEALDKERKAKGARGPLHGIPVLIKDNIDTADRMMTTAGSLALEGSIAARDSFVAQRLREAGAVILGKTNLSEWANFRSSHASSGWSGRGGQTKNPYVLDRNPCGSSSGSGASVSANLCAVAVGTETDGSVVCPSSANSLVGIKPTLGLVSRAGIIPIAHSQDTAGPMARTVTDAAILLGVLSGIDPRDAVTNESRGKSGIDYTKFLDRNGMQGARIGIARKFFGFNDGVDKLLDASIEEMKRLGAVIVDPADIPTMGKFDASEFEVLLFEFKADLNTYLSGLGPRAPVHSLKEIIEFNDRNAAREMPYFGQDIMIKAEAKGPLTSKDYLKALKDNHTLSRTEGIDAVMNKNKLDAMVAPTGGPPWPTDLLNGDHFTGGFSTPAAVAGYPHITVPAGYLHGLPFGISFFGRAYSEPVLIKLAYAYEQATHFRRPPQFLPHAEL